MFRFIKSDEDQERDRMITPNTFWTNHEYNSRGDTPGLWLKLSPHMLDGKCGPATSSSTRSKTIDNYKRKYGLIYFVFRILKDDLQLIAVDFHLFLSLIKTVLASSWKLNYLFHVCHLSFPLAWLSLDYYIFLSL